MTDIVDMCHIGRWWETSVAWEDGIITDTTFTVLKWSSCKDNWSKAWGMQHFLCLQCG